MIPLLFFGISIPAILAITYPCLCLNLGLLLLITYNLPFLRTILHSALLFLIDVLTFMSSTLIVYFGLLLKFN